MKGNIFQKQAIKMPSDPTNRRDKIPNNSALSASLQFSPPCLVGLYAILVLSMLFYRGSAFLERTYSIECGFVCLLYGILLGE
ncbi:hypothetical protein F5Y10DRAFT_235431 [Nemania abortiva]|nr:hypothetical protein F5Y10DRAFT_235431 [Nemania abortiva]